MTVRSTASLGGRPLGASVTRAVGNAAGIRIAFLVAALTPLVAFAFGLIIRRHNGESGPPD